MVGEPVHSADDVDPFDAAEILAATPEERIVLFATLVTRLGPAEASRRWLQVFSAADAAST